MQYTCYDLGWIQAKNRVRVKLGGYANVRIMEGDDYYNFKSRREHNYIGGYVKSRTYIATLPKSGHWFVVVDLGGESGTIKSEASILPPELPVAKEESFMEKLKRIF